MVLARAWKNALKGHARNVVRRTGAKGRAEGREEERAKWEAWNNRRMVAERDNKPFDEPPPSVEQQQTS